MQLRACHNPTSPKGFQSGSTAEREKLVRVAVYARVSTADKGQDPRVQTVELQEYCQRRGWHLTTYQFPFIVFESTTVK